MPRYFECPDSATEQPPLPGTSESGNYGCQDASGDAWIELTESPLPPEEPTVSFAEILVQPMFTEEERFILLGSITLAFATAWAFNILGKFIFPRN